MTTRNATLKHKTGTSVPSAGSAVVGELLIKTDTGDVWTKNGSGNMIHIGGLSPQIGSVTATGTSVTVDVSQKDVFRLTLQSNVTTMTLSGGVDGQRVVLEVIQDATGSRTITWPSNVRFGTDITSITLTTTASKTDRIGLIYNSSASKYDVVAFVKGF